ncbi:5-hydroxytryptamine receptor 3A-like [Pholidichthys leucotaenia]
MPLITTLHTVDGASCEKVCSYQDVLNHLNLTSDVFKMTRPVKDHTRTTTVQLDIILYAILAVIEKTQTFVPFVWATMKWKHEYISWDPDQFCGINRLSIPQELVWKPDLFIYEMIEKDDSPRNPYLYVFSDGTLFSEEDIRIVSTCQMDVYKFPFDTQRCKLSIGSAIHCVEEVRLLPISNASRVTQSSREIMQPQGEWEFLQLSISSINSTFNDRQWDNLIYTFTMRRRPLLHVINFLLPILFFLTLDLASFFISDYRGEKLGFKVTVLLAISVLLLILNDILPSMSNRTPLIATYCIVIFALMLLSLLETILVTYLMEKDSLNQHKDKHNNIKNGYRKADDKRRTSCMCICNVSDEDKQHELLAVPEEATKGIQAGENHVLLLILEELKELHETLNRRLRFREEAGTYAQWASKINNIFFIFYIITVSLFIPFIYNGVHSERNCSYQDVLNYLSLTKNKEVYSMTRPFRNYKHSTQVSLEVLLYAILDVVEKDQKFIPYVWTVMRWHNEYISWDPNQFCGTDNVSLPAEMLWKPDLTIEEM